MQEYCSLDISKKLAEANFSAGTTYNKAYYLYGDGEAMLLDYDEKRYIEHIPAYSIIDLLNVLPATIAKSYHPEIRIDNEGVEVSYSHIADGTDIYFSRNKSLADALGAIICQLIAYREIST